MRDAPGEKKWRGLGLKSYALAMIGVCDLEDSAREVMVVVNAAITLAAFSHVRPIEARIRHLLVSVS